VLIEYVAKFGNKKEDTIEGTFFASDSIVKKSSIDSVAREYISKQLGNRNEMKQLNVSEVKN
jgi:hypothetical protein